MKNVNEIAREIINIVLENEYDIIELDENLNVDVYHVQTNKSAIARWYVNNFYHERPENTDDKYDNEEHLYDMYENVISELKDDIRNSIGEHIQASLTAQNFHDRNIDERLVEATKDDVNHTTVYEIINDFLEDEEHDNDEERDASIEEHLKCFYDEYQNIISA